ncbi:DUF7660 family protein [Virgibacillus subterraneus]|uniref:DUF7660 family protein n=1 Tax=Virgibacillus subterraneus TaxID=621109 RepID=UPI003CCBE596
MKSEEESVSFIDKLKNDFEANKNYWESYSLTITLKQLKVNIKETNSLPCNRNWSSFVEILIAGKFYE